MTAGARCKGDEQRACMSICEGRNKRYATGERTTAKERKMPDRQDETRPKRKEQEVKGEVRMSSEQSRLVYVPMQLARYWPGWRFFSRVDSINSTCVLWPRHSETDWFCTLGWSTLKRDAGSSLFLRCRIISLGSIKRVQCGCTVGRMLRCRG